MSFFPNFALTFLLASTLPPLADASNETWGRRDCAVQSVSDVCTCEHKIWFKGLHCSKCKDKFKWGYGCDLECSKDRCPYGCDLSGNCNVPSTCKKNDRAEHAQHGVTNEHGECQACDGEWHGLWCTKKCPKNCGSSPEGVCTRGGKCYTCKEGFYGRQCDQECPKNCPKCVFDDNLIHAPDGETFLPAGTCPDQCKVDNHGPKCDQPCPANCKKTGGWFNRPRIPSCKKEDGKCFQCHDEKWWGETCENACSTGCEDDQCRKSDGLCKGGCKNGFFGDKCDKKCSSGCKGGGCNKESGKCDDGCNAGWRGDLCDQPCPEGTGPEGCDRKTGQPETCVEGSYPFKSFLEDGWIYKSCPDNCKTNKCDVHGNCLDGCQVGFHGGTCMSSCGSHCIGACDKTATNKKDGHCTNCETGFTGNKCNLKCHPTCKACKQGSGGIEGFFEKIGIGKGGTDDDECTSCAADEPVTLKDGHCECIEGATRDPNDNKCYCDQPTGEDAATKEAFFENRASRKECRFKCKDGTREVYGEARSMCITSAAYKAIVVSEVKGKGAQQGSCKDGQKEYTDSSGVKTCMGMDFVNDILKYL